LWFDLFFSFVLLREGYRTFGSTLIGRAILLPVDEVEQNAISRWFYPLPLSFVLDSLVMMLLVVPRDGLVTYQEQFVEVVVLTFWMIIGRVFFGAI